MIHVYVYAGITILIIGLLWIGFTLPASSMINENMHLYQGTAQTIVRYMTTYINVIPVLIGIGLIAWGFVKSVEERELGYTTI